MRIRFDPFVLDVSEARLLRDGVPISVQPLVIDLLRFFAERQGQLVTREEMLAGVWPGVRVSDQTLSQAVRRARKALGDDAENERFIETVAKRGYRFIASVTVEEAAEPERPAHAQRVSALPATLPEIIGRDELLRELLYHIRGEEPLITLMGTGGIGKTLLALHAARRSDLEALFVDLAAVRSAEAVTAALSEALGLRTSDEPLLALASALTRPPHAPRILILLDNAEHVLDSAASLVAALLKETASVCFLVTSREAMRLTSERVIPVGPLPIEEAAALFLQRAAARGQDPAVQPETLRAIVSALDGIPLAIELAAARLGLLSPSEMLARLDQPLSLLGTAARDKSARHSTMRAALQWSWDLLDPIEQVCLRALAVFRGSFSLDAASAVLPEGTDPWQILEALLGKSLLSRGAPGRFLLTRVVRSFASEQRDLAAVQRHAAHYGALGARLYARELSDPSFDPIPEAAIERDELLAAVERAERADDAAGALLGLARLLVHHGPQTTLVTLGRSLLGRPDLSPVARAQVGHAVGTALPARDGLAMLTSAYEQAISLGQSDLSGVLTVNCSVSAMRCDMQEARAWFERAEREAPPVWRSVLLAERATMYWRECRYEEAKATYEDAVWRFESEGNRRYLALTLGNLGLLDIETGRYGEARQRLEEALDIARSTDDRRMEAMARGYLGDLSRAEGAPLEAIHWLTAAVDLHRRVGHLRFVAMDQISLAEAQRDAGLLADALQTARSALPAVVQLGDKRALGLAKGILAELTPDDRLFDESDALLTEVSDGMSLARNACARARSALRAGRIEEARARCERAEQLAAALNIGPDAEITRTLRALRAALPTGDPSRANPPAR